MRVTLLHGGVSMMIDKQERFSMGFAALETLRDLVDEQRDRDDEFPKHLHSALSNLEKNLGAYLDAQLEQLEQALVTELHKVDKVFEPEQPGDTDPLAVIASFGITMIEREPVTDIQDIPIPDDFDIDEYIPVDASNWLSSVVNPEPEPEPEPEPDPEPETKASHDFKPKKNLGKGKIKPLDLSSLGL